MTGQRPLRFGLAGTGYWARIAHAPALASTAGIEFAAVWGRNQDAAADLAAAYGIPAHHDIEAFLDGLDGVAFAVPPDVQAGIGARAAAAGKHLLLEKPIAISAAAASSLVSAVEQAQVASVVFFTARFEAGVRAWLADVTARGGWAGAAAIWLGTALQPSNPFDTPWRRDKGALWDLGPHVVSLLWASLGPVSSVIAEGGPADVSNLILQHEGGASSTATVTLSAPEPAEHFEFYLWGEAGRSAVPREEGQTVIALRTALTELAHNARSGQVSHDCDVRFGYAVWRVLAEAQRQIDARRPPGNG